jgi:hypothetical protein
MLLASLPTGTTIPDHHDTGEWVKRTHRVHVPVLVNEPSKIVFRCGASPDNMQAIECRPGHVFEINNQAKHTVSNCDSDYRVHLILDYVDDKQPKERIPLRPGEILLQTRRSIDRLACKGQRPTPSFMILGAQKAGTTFLFELIMQHPLLIRPRRRETHCLDWRWNDQLETQQQRQKWCHQFYHEQQLQLHPSCLTGDSTPSYLLDSVRVIPRLQQVFPWRLKFFVTCRDPVKRAESHYAMATSPHGTPAQLKARGSEWRNKSFQQIVRDDLRKMHQCGLIPYWEIDGIDDGGSDVKNNIENRLCNSQFDQAVFEAFAGSAQEDKAWDCYLRAHVPLNTGSYGLLSRGLYELNLRPWFRAFDPKDFLVLKLEAMNTASATSTTLKQVWNHLNVPSIDTVPDTTAKNTREYAPIVTNEMQSFLQRFYEPHNQRLTRMLWEQQRPGMTDECWQQHWSESWDYTRMLS